MNCYRMLKAGEEAISLSDNPSLAPYIASAEEELAAVLISASWVLEETYTWSCFAENDGGIDATEETVTNLTLQPQSFVFENGTPVGYFYRSCVLTFSDGKPLELFRNDDKEYVPCWGTVSDSYAYRLRPIPDRQYLLSYDKTKLRYENACLIEDGTLLITCGELPKSFTLPDGVKAIAKGVFAGIETLESVVLPEGLAVIGEEAFKGCTALKAVSFPSTLTTIGSFAFYRCEALTTVRLPDSLTAIGSCAFGRNPALAEVTLPAAVTVIPYALFVGCTALASLTLPEKLSSIDRNAFEDCTALQALVIPDTVTAIGTEAFKNCTSLERVTLSASLKTLDSHAFENCTALRAIATPPTLGEIAHATFRGCTALAEVTLSEGLTAIGNLAFDGCTALTEVALPATLEKLGAYPFKGTSLTSLTLPEGLTALDFAVLGGTKVEAFTVSKALAEELRQYFLHNAVSLKTLIFAEGVTVIHHPDEYRVRYGNEDVRFPAGIAKTLKTVETVVLPSTLTTFDPSLLPDAPALKTVRIAKGFSALSPAIFPSGITVCYEGTKAEWLAAYGEDVTHTLKSKLITVLSCDGTV
ncbi:MAG: leucine-rich repeat domain-containing protein [Clostridia bacterium]|nr:leucine-rich repeat domain-containing protein [Clostridia bacterium]